MPECDCMILTLLRKQDTTPTPVVTKDEFKLPLALIVCDWEDNANAMVSSLARRGSLLPPKPHDNGCISIVDVGRQSRNFFSTQNVHKVKSTFPFPADS